MEGGGRRQKPRNQLAGMYMKGARAVAVRSVLESRGVKLRTVEAIEAVPVSEAERRRQLEVKAPLGKAREREKCEHTVRDPASGAAGTVVKCPTCGCCGALCGGHAQFFPLARTIFAPQTMKNLASLLGCFKATRAEDGSLHLGPLLNGGAARKTKTGEPPSQARLWREWPCASQRFTVTEVRAAGDTQQQPHGGRGGGAGRPGRCGLAALRVSMRVPGADQPVTEVWDPERVRFELLTLEGAPRPDEEFAALGFEALPGDGGDSPHAAWCEAAFFWDSVYVTPYPTRQKVVTRSASDAPDLTSKYNKLFQDCRKYEALQTAGATRSELDAFWSARVVDELHTMVLRNPRAAGAGSQVRAPQHAVAATLHGKKMLLRGLLSRRRDGISRAVICPCSSMALGWVGLPLAMMNGLTVTEVLRPWNQAQMHVTLLQLTERPGNPQLFVSPPGALPNRRNLFEEAADRRDVREIILGLTDGWTVTRSLVDGDTVFFNRQPTLWDNGYTAFRARLIAERHVITFNPLHCAPFNADYDGDEMNVVVLSFADGAAEAYFLAGSERHALTCKNGGPVLSLALDSMVGANLGSRAEAQVSRDHVASLLRGCSDAAVAAAGALLPADKRAPVPARALLSACVLAHMGPSYCYSVEGVCYIENGHVVQEMIMRQLARPADDSLLAHAIRARGFRPALAMLKDLDALCCGYARVFGTSLHAWHYDFYLAASAALTELCFALRVWRDAEAWNSENADERRALLLASVRELLLVPFDVPRERWEDVFAAVGASAGPQDGAAAAFRAAGVDGSAVSARPAEVDRMCSYGLPLLAALRRARGRSAEESFDAFVTSLKASACASIRASLHPLHPLLLFLVLAVTKNKGNLDSVNAQLGSRANRAVVADAFEGRATVGHAAGSDHPAAARYFATSQKRGLKPESQAANGAHARANMTAATAGTQEPGDKNKVANFNSTNTKLAPSGAVVEADGTPISSSYGDGSGCDEKVSLRLAPVPNPPLVPAAAAGVPYDPAAPWAAALQRTMRLPVPVAQIYDDLARASSRADAARVSEEQAAELLEGCLTAVERACALPGMVGRVATSIDEDTPRAALVPLLAVLRCVFWPPSMAGRASPEALAVALRRVAREYEATRAPAGENVGTKATLSWTSGWTQTSLNSNHGSGGASNAAAMRHLFNMHDPHPFLTLTVEVAAAPGGEALDRAVCRAAAWLTACPLSEVADWKVVRSPGSDLWTPGVLARAPADSVAVVVAPRGRGWTGANLREALLDAPRVAALARDAPHTDLPLSLAGDEPAPRVALLVARDSARDLVTLLSSTRVGLLRSVTVTVKSPTCAELAGGVADPVPASPLGRVLAAAPRLSVVRVSSSDPADVRATFGLAAFRHHVFSRLKAMFQGSVDETHLGLVADWMAARGGRGYTTHALGPLSRLFFRKTAAALDAVALGGGKEHMGLNLHKVVLPGPARVGSQYPRVQFR